MTEYGVNIYWPKYLRIKNPIIIQPKLKLANRLTLDNCHKFDAVFDSLWFRLMRLTT